MGDYRVKVTIRNAKFLRAVESLGLSATGFAKKYGFQPTEVCGIAAMTKSPIYKNGDWKASVVKLCELTNIMPDDLFTRNQKYSLLKVNHATKEVDEAEISSILGSGRALVGSENPEDNAIRKELVSLVMSKINKLPSRYKKVLKMRRIEGIKLEEIGVELGITRERVRQIEYKAVRMLKRAIGGSAKYSFDDDMLRKMGLP